MEQVVELVSDVAKSAPGKFAADREADPAELSDKRGRLLPDRDSPWRANSRRVEAWTWFRLWAGCGITEKVMRTAGLIAAAALSLVGACTSPLSRQGALPPAGAQLKDASYTFAPAPG